MPSKNRPATLPLPYLLPHTADEANRLEFQHHLLRVALAHLYLAPIERTKSGHMLDVACGTGRWAKEAAILLPKWRVIGMDYVPPFFTPHDDHSPRNYRFIQANMFARFPFATNSFDFVHMRLVSMATPLHLWQPLLEEIIRVTKPGGYIELVESFLPLDTGPCLASVVHSLLQMADQYQLDLRITPSLEKRLATAHVEYIYERMITIPVGRKWGRLGNLCEMNVLALCEALTTVMVQSGMYSAEEWHMCRKGISRELYEQDTILPIFQAYGQKKQK